MGWDGKENPQLASYPIPGGNYLVLKVLYMIYFFSLTQR
jgi:hypothetical protein